MSPFYQTNVPPGTQSLFPDAVRKVPMKSPELAARVRDGQMTLAVAHREIRRAEHKQELCCAESLRAKGLCFGG